MQTLGILGPAEMFLGLFSLLIPLGLIALFIVLINNWVNKSLQVKKEQNELLKELIKTIGQKKE